jgi:hypothetical protein
VQARRLAFGTTTVGVLIPEIMRRGARVLGGMQLTHIPITQRVVGLRPPLSLTRTSSTMVASVPRARPLAS